MKTMLFLYPIRPYIDNEIDRHWHGEHVDQLRVTFNMAITERFRRHGWRIIWLLFASESNTRVPDSALISPFIDFEKTDEFITVPISFARHCKEKRYPSAYAVIRKLGRVSKLAVCGFHCTDCVRRIAQCAYKQGIPVKVHEELTEYFFYLEVWRSVGPHVKSISSRKQFKRFSGSTRALKAALGHERCIRRKQPWLWQWR